MAKKKVKKLTDAEKKAEVAANMLAKNDRLIEEEKAEQEKAAEQAEEQELQRPLSAEEKAELETLEARANSGTNMPQGAEMLRLGKLRQRAKNK